MFMLFLNDVIVEGTIKHKYQYKCHGQCLIRLVLVKSYNRAAVLPFDESVS